MASPQVYMLAAAGFFVNAAGNMVAPIIAIYAKESIGASITETGLVVSAFAISSAALRIPTGAVIKTSNTAAWMLLGMAILTFAPVAYTFASSVAVLVAFRLLHGFGNAVSITTLLTSVSVASTKEGEARSITIYTVGAAIGLAAGPALTVVVLVLTELRWAFVVAGLVNLPCIALALKLFSSWKPGETLSPKAAPAKQIVEMLKDKNVVSYALMYLSFTTFGSALTAFAPLHAKDFFKMSDQLWSSIFFGYSLLLFLTRLLLTRIVSHGNLRLLTYFGLLNAIASSVIVAYAPQPYLFAAGVALAGLSHGFLYPLGAIMTANHSPPARRTFANSVYLLGGDTGFLLGPLVAAPLASEYGIPVALAAIGLTPLLGVLLTRRARSANRH